MTPRQERRAAEHKARKLAYKAAKAAAANADTNANTDSDITVEPIVANPTDTSVAPNPSVPTEALPNIPEPGTPFPSLMSMSPARLAANRANAQLSSGPVTFEGKAISSQNRTTHGLARHTGAFRLLSTEDHAAFEALKQSLIDEHQPSTPTEEILVTSMAESHWLTQRCQRLQALYTDPDTGIVTDEKQFALYLRYQTTHDRAFHKSLNALLKLRAEKRKAEIGFEAQRIKNEQHEMKKDQHYWEVLRKDAEACVEISRATMETLKSSEQCPGFEAQYAAELAQRGVKRGAFNAAMPAAA